MHGTQVDDEAKQIQVGGRKVELQDLTRRPCRTCRCGALDGESNLLRHGRRPLDVIDNSDNTADGVDRAVRTPELVDVKRAFERSGATGRAAYGNVPKDVWRLRRVLCGERRRSEPQNREPDHGRNEEHDSHPHDPFLLPRKLSSPAVALPLIRAAEPGTGLFAKIRTGTS